MRKFKNILTNYHLTSLRLNWNSGHVWKNVPSHFKIEDIADDYFEYKFVIRETKNPGNVLRWQQGENNIFDLKRMVLTVK